MSNPFQRVAVTGGTGKAGRATIAHLREHGYQVVNIDRVACDNIWDTRLADLTDFGQAVDAMSDCQAVVHLAAIPAPGLATDQTTFANNTLSTYNVFLAAKTLGMPRVVWASSETTLGLSFVENPPAAAPITEADPLNPRTSYAHSKVLGEEMGRFFHQTAGISSAALRLSNVMAESDYQWFEGWQDDPGKRAWNLWGYIDARDAAQAFRLSLEATYDGAEAFIIANDDTVMRQPTAELLAAEFPNAQLRDLPHDRATLLSIDKAKAVLGFNPTHRWQEQV